MKKDIPTIQEWKIWPPYEILYIESLFTLTKRITEDYEYLDSIITDQELLQTNSHELIDISENIINGCAAVSRYLNPTKQNSIHKLRGEKLRKYLSINDDNILLSREVRNFIEHFDENLDTFLQQPIAGNIYPKRVVFNSNELDEVCFVFKCYIVNEFKYKTLDREVNILPLTKEIYRIYNLLVEFRINGGRLK